MAKRRNPKKEKALRNQAYARKFRKRSSGRYSRRLNTENRPETKTTETVEEMTDA
ncbi:MULTISPECIES: hypothetical protein [Thermosynechococcus]|jgi:Txe/YoeB family toxin of Txe-Axe toxin-antitoxin module|uniref:Tsr1734 protein n=2 Tax=Thermosynechococcus TaxID=146785 RepID=Q8DI57_THEVB|nr:MULTISPECIES: hypothetical protein [Thermosynechococcus]RMH65866.1 MAG: hypothetical protein D6676_06750 [Cyanobacteria bacterium J003]BAY50772.1 hypothetical protein NIES2134_116510 [Thermostichus vulcanus NIES-2134]HIK24386.1 hypothetical protein [Thermosynechococcus sp. M46_R2017_013]AHB88379.1 hypothetical protein NK55_05310 [Thermosynechococcus sp. NK55a]MDM7326787.1 hypothetical protein [Thermosynechococcus sp. Uc]